jgi:hypothetical protein
MVLGTVDSAKPEYTAFILGIKRPMSWQTMLKRPVYIPGPLYHDIVAQGTVLVASHIDGERCCFWSLLPRVGNVLVHASPLTLRPRQGKEMPNWPNSSFRDTNSLGLLLLLL